MTHSVLSQNHSRWTTEQVQNWWEKQGWVNGFNYLPSTAVNFIEMWYVETFDTHTITQELQWGAALGYNALRVNLPFVVWHHDPIGLLERIDTFLSIAHKNHIQTVVCFFDDCEFSGEAPVYAKQNPPIPNLHNSRAVASPGRDYLCEIYQTPIQSPAREEIKNYVVAIMERFRNDERILFWDLYNEPGNRMIFKVDGYDEYPVKLEEASYLLLKDSFRWGRQVAPRHPLTIGAWQTGDIQSWKGISPYQNKIDQAALALSDIITFHAYLPLTNMKTVVQSLMVHQRPLLCTEWMARILNSRIETILPYFKKHHIGAFQWGFIQGKTQTYLPWPEKILQNHDIAHNLEDEWFHDLLYPNGDAYSPAEIEKVKELNFTSFK